MKYRHCLCFLAVLACAAMAAFAEESPHVISGGGNTAESSTMRVQSTVGQALVRSAERDFESSTTDWIGFWYMDFNTTTPPSGVLPDAPMVNFLGQNSPNPFNPSTTITFAISSAGHVRMGLYDLKGHLLALLVDSNLSSGRHSLVFHPDRLPSGVYFYRIESGSFRETRRLTLLK